MLTASYRSRLVTKIIASPSGEQYKATFLATFVDGCWIGRLITVEIVSAGALEGSTAVQHPDALCLPYHKTADGQEAADQAFAATVSPYVSLIGLIIHSQPTRAPSFA
ncbi:MAG: hypothetical protein KGI69_02575 [Patescibacteria group bacterium]|nr:hypothetical protein [Patescibacteria group bacterium]